jgi:hypothetical protein
MAGDIASTILLEGARRWIIDVLRIVFFICLIATFIILLICKWQITISPTIGFKRPTDTDFAKEGLAAEPETLIQWNQRKYVVEMTSGYALEIRDDVARIRQAFPDFLTRGQDSCVIKQDAANKIIRNAELFRSIKSELNYYEGLASAYLNGVADRKMFDVAFRKIL